MLYILNVNVVIIPEKDFSKSGSPWKCHEFWGKNVHLTWKNARLWERTGQNWLLKSQKMYIQPVKMPDFEKADLETFTGYLHPEEWCMFSSVM